MPKLVDHNKRKEQIAEATWRTILKKGMEGATVRNIAKEAGLSLGSLRHYFSTQDELLVFAMNLVEERVTDRINKIATQDIPLKEKILKILLEIVPTNQETMAEMEVWFAFTFHMRHRNNKLKDHDDKILLGMKNIVNYLHESRLLIDHLDKDTEAERLYALVDGLALHAMLEPERVNQQRVLTVLESHLHSICTDELRE
ncbi:MULTISPECIES: TetR/AcrR family transcriptional regulator [Bacillus]|uniref:TetR family transcriptional regulator n=2 Tax=Bacillus TaxID=1386 RepID=A0A0M3RAQ8_9BACI|nr:MULTISPECIES: TetR/AcrR family transcriptional regulator [Bacillus]ALC83626.1 TetR family transcriptional regulator [Bacillus gobiensis]MBP1082634.1 AcrR family transcriptional regulator [Bacillus capparidis]MED1097138.1 TetR/AcrR family transcriptional regulator [Bacillus capparidis]